MSASIIQLYRLVDIEDPVSIPPPPVPHKGWCPRSRRPLRGLGLTATCWLLIGILCLLGSPT
jgi:hypothetical protein